VGIAGENSAIPMGSIIFGASFLALLSYYLLVHKASIAKPSIEKPGKISV
jgi:DHA1 family bicyclomycin/chloramphenicol resistance-like MFS transporter